MCLTGSKTRGVASQGRIPVTINGGGSPGSASKRKPGSIAARSTRSGLRNSPFSTGGVAASAALRSSAIGFTDAPLPHQRSAYLGLARGIKRLSDAGVRIGVGTDGGGQLGDQFVGWTMHTEVENMVAAGMTPMQVLVAATRTSAGIAGLDDLGTVAVGKSADFVVLDANPLDNITNTRRINRVYMRGVEVPRAEMRAKWQAEYRAAAAK